MYTGDEWYVHLQLKMPTHNNSSIASLTACRGNLNAEVPLEPLDVSSNENPCRPPITNFVSSKANPIKLLSLINLVIALLVNVLISIVIMVPLSELNVFS